ncbi:hypothetical protein A9Q84_17525 [Halobacteriovorax marinus]|uniref:Uncharacterized protein n=1 Tax=Halobacteriovorax marinus TaxID=97084 RepID=A0A1Y5F339_9BACT|nr:hypothetical protein A9Q84_17525 [Halobacteriovorax marinus]
MTFCKSLLLLLLPLQISAAVWHADNAWNENFERKYQSWVTSNKVHANIFTDSSSDYYGIKADCADAAYAIRAIFSLENSLPFAITNPSGSRGQNKALSNTVSAFDNISNSKKRFVAFINYIGNSVGSENLTRLDTYPVKLSSIKAASLFTYRIKGRFGKAIRHVYTIKDVVETGNFDLIYSTQAIRKDGLPMNYRPGKELVNLPHDVWGFKRFLWPAHLGRSTSHYPEHYEYSQEQFTLAKKYSSAEFFSYVKNILKTTDETPNAKIKRALTNICHEATQRIHNIQQGVNFNLSITGRCMNYREYDIYSTPARDKALKASYESLIYHWNNVGNQVSDNELAILSESILDSDYADASALLTFCPIAVAGLKTFHLSEIWEGIKRGDLSSHPNDSLSARWGMPGSRTNCKVWY